MKLSMRFHRRNEIIGKRQNKFNNDFPMIEPEIAYIKGRENQKKPQVVFKMIRQDILEGLKLALLKKESLKQAMISFYNAGYEKQDIEDSARALQSQKIKPELSSQNSQPKSLSPKKQIIQKISNYGKKSLPIPKTMQKVSNYEKKPKGKWKIYIMVLILLILLGILAAVYFFKPELVEFFNKLFG